MGWLRSLYMCDAIFWKPLKIDALHYLKILTYISIYDWTYDVSSLERMAYLRKLGIEEVDENSDVGKLFASLAKMENRHHLILRGFCFRSMSCLDEIGVIKGLKVLKLDGRLGRLPNTDNLPQGIYDLILVNTCLDEDPMPLLEKLLELLRLKLRNAYTGREMVIQCNSFPSFESFGSTNCGILQKYVLEKVQCRISGN